MRADALTDRQVQILRVIRNWIADHGEGHSIRQIGERVGLSSSSSVADQLDRLDDLWTDQPHRAALAFLPAWYLNPLVLLRHPVYRPVYEAERAGSAGAG
ncbi:hypothetical protein P8A21_39475 (plasmid) [Streptomyces poriferorum]|uniref:LexA family protein n=1 Tax=Streptomyces poriferorum TaxID=2798799 RepID=UPI00273D315A|nr:hypothetical protein [Streptomyces sp. Alt1]WLQ53640.1 hypothetical protein P8A21_39475 [Streptomyces sp. Alt1]